MGNSSLPPLPSLGANPPPSGGLVSMPMSAQQQARLTPPPPPKITGTNGKTVVDTDALEIFADNMGKLVAPVQDAVNQLKGTGPVQAGVFYRAFELANLLSGGPGADPVTAAGGVTAANSSNPPASQNLFANYLAVLNSLAAALGALQNEVKQMGAKYKTADELSKASVADLQNDLSSVQSAFNAVMAANGGGSAAAGGTSGAPSAGGITAPGGGGSGSGGSGG